MSLAIVSRFLIPEGLLLETEEELRAAGRDGYEVFVLWSGMVDDATFAVKKAHVPEQTSFKLADGLCVRVDGDALHALNVWLFQEDQILGAQVHAHPEEAYHSETDDAYPVVTLMGGASIVAPRFCAGHLTDTDVATYRLSASGWEPLGNRRLLEVA